MSDPWDALDESEEEFIARFYPMCEELRQTEGDEYLQAFLESRLRGAATILQALHIDPDEFPIFRHIDKVLADIEAGRSISP